LHVTIADMAFQPAVLHARVGDIVVWTNDDLFRHTATAKDGGFNIDLPVKASGRTTLKRRGRIDYACAYHSGMTGRIVVE
jgi:plastocyanin